MNTTDGLQKAIQKALQKEGRRQTALHKKVFGADAFDTHEDEREGGKYHVGAKQDRLFTDPVTGQEILFDSIAERNRYIHLRGLLKAGVIFDLVLQPSYILLDPFTDKFGTIHKGISYRADFQYWAKDGITYVEDVKGMQTPVYRMKKKLFLYRYPEYTYVEIGVKEVNS